MTVASDRKVKPCNMKRSFYTILLALVIGILVLFYITNEEFRDQLIEIQSDLSKKISKPKKDKGVNKSKIDNIEDPKLMESVSDGTETNYDFKTEAQSLTRKNSDISSEEDEVTPEEIEQFHNKNEADLNQENDYKTTVSTTTTPLTTKNRGELKKRFPSAIIAGVKKCGTRALLSFLSEHPMIQSAGREIHFFDKNETYALGLDWYLDQMPKSYDDELTVEKTPGYFVQPYVPERVYNFSKTVKLIFIFREPVKRAVSDYAQAISKSKKLGSFEKKIFLRHQKQTINEKASKISIGLYAKHLIKWLHYFPKIQMHFVDGDEFIRNPVPEIIKVQKFLGLPVLLDDKSFVYNKTKGFYCVRHKPYQNDTKCLGESKGRPHPYVKEETLSLLSDFYKHHNQKFFELIGKNFGWPT